MQKIKQLYGSYETLAGQLSALPLLAIRLVLAYGFYGTAKMKWSDINAVADWFGQLGIPAPLANAYLAASTETLGVVLLILGFGTRIISIPLMIVMIVAIVTVHWTNGFEAGNNGFEIPLYYLIMLSSLISFGAGSISIDHFFENK